VAIAVRFFFFDRSDLGTTIKIETFKENTHTNQPLTQNFLRSKII
jgi:hypothetical protein